MPEVIKVPQLKCKKCGSIRVVMTRKGPECECCDVKFQPQTELTEQVEYKLYEQRKGN